MSKTFDAESLCLKPCQMTLAFGFRTPSSPVFHFKTNRSGAVNAASHWVRFTGCHALFSTNTMQASRLASWKTSCFAGVSWDQTISSPLAFVM